MHAVVAMVLFVPEISLFVLSFISIFTFIRTYPLSGLTSVKLQMRSWTHKRISKVTVSLLLLLLWKAFRRIKTFFTFISGGPSVLWSKVHFFNLRPPRWGKKCKIEFYNPPFAMYYLLQVILLEWSFFLVNICPVKNRFLDTQAKCFGPFSSQMSIGCNAMALWKSLTCKDALETIKSLLLTRSAPLSLSLFLWPSF